MNSNVMIPCCPRVEVGLAVVGLVLAALASCAPATAQVRQTWVARYDGPSSLHDGANAIAVDVAGNVYTAGGSNQDFATVKYDPAGRQLWVARYRSSSRHDALAIAVDGAGMGFVCVAGNSNSDLVTVMYDHLGNELWVARYVRAGIYGDGGAPANRCLAVDATGHVCVVGSEHGTGALVTIKYDAVGSQVWATRYTGPFGGVNTASGLGIDAAGNVYVTASSPNSSIYNPSDYATIKYDPMGNELWARRHDGGTHDRPEGGLAVDAAGNVYVTGHSERWNAEDYTTIKYDTNGNLSWLRRYNGTPGKYVNLPYDIGLDAAGNVYVTGESYGTSGWEAATVKYDANGNFLWDAIAFSTSSQNFFPPFAKRLVVGAQGDVAVTGSVAGDYVTIQYDTHGNQLWMASYDGPVSQDDRATAITADGAGHLYVTGRSDGGATGVDYATIRYDRCGTLTSYGTGLAGSGGVVPQITARGCALPGERIDVDIGQGLGGARGCLLLGVSQQSVPLLGGAVLVAPIPVCVAHTLGGSGPGNGSHTWPLSIPHDPVFVDVFCQGVYVDPGAVHGVSFSNGLHIHSR